MSLHDTLENSRRHLLSKKNVVGVGIGEKWSEGVNTHEPALLVFVSKKESSAVLSSHDNVPKTIEGTKTDVVGKTGIIKAHALTDRIRPIQPGYSCGHTQVTAGTLGAFFKDADDQIVGLSNNHVLAAVNRGTRGDRIVQPGVYDQSNWSGNVVGNLKFYRPLASRYELSFNAADWTGIYGYNLEDAGIFVASGDVNSVIPGIGEINDFRDSVTIGETLRKVGRTTGLTSGQVIATSATMTVNYGNNLNYEFRDQIVTGPMSQGGDSGSALLDSNRNIVGLLFAGSDSITIHNRIRYPRSSWGLKIYHSQPLVETMTYTVTVDGVVQVNNYIEADFLKATQDARTLARTGKSVSVVANFTAHP